MSSEPSTPNQGAPLSKPSALLVVISTLAVAACGASTEESDSTSETTDSSSTTWESGDTGGYTTDTSPTETAVTEEEECDGVYPLEIDDASAEELCAFDPATTQLLARDTFSTMEGELTFATEFGSYDWVSSNGEAEGYHTVVNGALELHYFSGEEGSRPVQWVSLDRLTTADTVIEARLKTHSPRYDNLLGLAWRMPSQDGHFSHAGYRLLLREGTVSLLAGQQLLDEVEVGDDHDWHDYRVASRGDAHCVWRDEVLILSARDATFMEAGYTGVTSWYSIGYIDDLEIHEHSAGEAPREESFELYDAFARPDDLSLGTLEKGGYDWVENELGDAGIITLSAGAAHFNPGLSEVSAHLDGFDEESVELIFDVEAGRAGGGGEFGGWIRASAESPVPGIDGYRVVVDDEEVRLTRGGEVLGSAEFLLDNVSHRYRLVGSGRVVTLYRDGIELFSSSSSEEIAGGGVGLFATNATVDFTELALRDLSAPPLHPTESASAPDELQFPALFYSVDEDHLLEARGIGANITQSYQSMGEYAEVAGSAGLGALVNIGTYYVDDSDPQPMSSEGAVKAAIARASEGESAVWWAAPEELRTWRGDELAELQNLHTWSRDAGADARPLFMYNPGHRTAEDMAELVPWLDIVGKGAYVAYSQQPRAWVRHQVESTIEGISLAGASVGSDWMAGEKTPIVITGVWEEYPATATELYHDLFSGVVSGARAAAVFSYAHGVKPDSLDGLAGFAEGARHLNSDDHPLGRAVLLGREMSGLAAQVTDGPTTTEPFTPSQTEMVISYPCLQLAGWEHSEGEFVVAVNSCEEALTATLMGLGDGNSVTLPFEQRELCGERGRFDDTFEPLEVHIYRIDPI